MGEVNIDQEPGKNTEADAGEDISWADALEDLERQKQMLKEQGQQHARREHTSEQTASAGKGEGAPPNLKFILDIPLQVTVELGRKRLLVHDLLQLSQGSIIELTKQIGEPFEVLVNQKLIARGEVVVINDKFGVRITDIISPMERVQQL
ncbi:MAG TPA: flagellar motor switch protein FliN [Candidatus Tectomicrobia bacterium]|jgi:flagellar motor switch protein FliN/FliY